MTDETAGSHARTRYTRLIPGVTVSRHDEVTTVSSPQVKLTVRCTPEVSYQLSQAAYASVAGLPESLVTLLSSHALAVCGATGETAAVAAVHASQNGAHNGGEPYDVSTLLSWQDDARHRRLPLPAGTLSLGGAFRPARSFAVDPGHHRDASADDVAAVVESFYHHLEVPYASAGALYPVHVVGELVGHGTCRAEGPDFRATWRPASSGQPSIEDPSLAGTAARIWFVLDLNYTARKYGSRSYRYGLIETGAAATYLEHVAASLDLATRQFGGFDDGEVSSRLQAREGVLVTHCLGLRRRRNAADPAPAVSVQALRTRATVVHMATAWEGAACGSGPPQQRGDGAAVPERMLGQAVDTDSSIAIAKATSELAERLAFIRDPHLRTTNGMAAHPLQTQARLNACLELYERHCLMTRWFRRTPPALIDPPDDEVAAALASITAGRDMEVAYGGMTDPAWLIPAAVVVVRSTTSGAVLLGTAAAPELARAARSASLEVLKSLMHRIQRAAPGESLFESHRTSAEHLRAASDHESYFANHEVARDETDVLVPGGRCEGPARATPESLARLVASTTIAEVLDSPDRNHRHVAVATHPELVEVRFGQCPDDYRASVIALLGVDPLPLWPHPLG